MRDLAVSVVEKELAEFGADGRMGDTSTSTSSSSSSSKMSDCQRQNGRNEEAGDVSWRFKGDLDTLTNAKLDRREYLSGYR